MIGFVFAVTEAVLVESVLDRSNADVEHLGRPRGRTADRLQCRDDRGALDLGHRRSGYVRRPSQWLRWLEREVIDLYP